VGVDVVFDGGRRGVDLPRADWPLPASPFQAALDFFAFEGDARAVFFYDLDRCLFGPFVGRETPPALNALAAPPNRQSILARAGVDDAIVINATERAFHICVTIHDGAAMYS